MSDRAHTALKIAEEFIAEELQCRKDSLLPASGNDARYVTQAQSALDAVRVGIANMERSGWQPIETAPKDGTASLGYDDLSGSIYVIHWQPHYQYWAISPGVHVSRMTHWKPLPEPPTSASTPAPTPAPVELSAAAEFHFAEAM